MKFLGSVRWRLFLTGWLVYSLHFATNIVREHYPAFTIAESFTLKVDPYLGFHSDIFQHRDGHAYVGNNVLVSVLAAVPLFVFDPVLDALEARSKAALVASGGEVEATYDTRFPNRREFFRRVKAAGLDLRFGAAAMITSVFFMAPFSALFLVLLYHVLVRRGVAEGRAVWLTLLFGLATPVFFRTAHLNHNIFLMYAAFASYWLLWRGEDRPVAPGTAARFWAGFLAGFCLAADYSGVVLLLPLYGYLLVSRASEAGWATSIRESFVFVVGAVPPVLFLWWSQWAMYGHPFMPGQYWMPDVNYTDRGWRGISLPTADLFFLNLFEPRYGLLTWGPLMVLAFVPAWWYPRDRLVLPRRERWFVIALFVVNMLFFAANQYSRMQFNSGFRYLIPVLPFLFLAASDHMARMRRSWLIAITAVAGLHSWVLTVFREQSIFDSWRLFFAEGIQLPWLRVMRQTSMGGGVIGSPIVAPALIALTLLVIGWLWWYGGRVGRAAGVRESAVRRESMRGSVANA